MNERVTSKDVARISGVSQSTVSRVFSDKKNLVKPEIQQLVRETAKNIGYYPNLIARGMISGKTNIVALLIGDNIGPHYNRLINLFITRIQSLGKQCLVFQVTRQDNLDAIISRVIQFHVEAAIITASAMTEHMVKACSENSIPVILYNRYVEGLPVHTVYADSITGGTLVADYLYTNGHRNIGYVRFTKDTGEEIGKKNGLYSRLREYGIDIAQEEKTAYNYDEGYAAALRMLHPDKKHLTAVFCTSDIVALGFMDGARHEYGINIPQELSVIGYDDIAMASWKSYELTTVCSPTEALVDKVIATLNISLHKNNHEFITEMLEPFLVERNTVQKISD